VDDLVALFQALNVAEPASNHPDIVRDALHAKQAVLLELDARTLALLRDHPRCGRSQCRYKRASPALIHHGLERACVLRWTSSAG